MMLTLRGLPPDIKISEIRMLIQQRCSVDKVLLDELQTDIGHTSCVTVALMNDSDAEAVRRSLAGERLGIYSLYVEPYQAPNSVGNYANNKGREKGGFGGGPIPDKSDDPASNGWKSTFEAHSGQKVQSQGTGYNRQEIEKDKRTGLKRSQDAVGPADSGTSYYGPAVGGYSPPNNLRDIGGLGTYSGTNESCENAGQGGCNSSSGSFTGQGGYNVNRGGVEVNKTAPQWQQVGNYANNKAREKDGFGGGPIPGKSDYPASNEWKSNFAAHSGQNVQSQGTGYKSREIEKDSDGLQGSTGLKRLQDAVGPADSGTSYYGPAVGGNSAPPNNLRDIGGLGRYSGTNESCENAGQGGYNSSSGSFTGQGGYNVHGGGVEVNKTAPQWQQVGNYANNKAREKDGFSGGPIPGKSDDPASNGRKSTFAAHSGQNVQSQGTGYNRREIEKDSDGLQGSTGLKRSQDAVGPADSGTSYYGPAVGGYSAPNNLRDIGGLGSYSGKNESCENAGQGGYNSSSGSFTGQGGYNVIGGAIEVNKTAPQWQKIMKIDDGGQSVEMQDRSLVVGKVDQYCQERWQPQSDVYTQDVQSEAQHGYTQPMTGGGVTVQQKTTVSSGWQQRQPTQVHSGSQATPVQAKNEGQDGENRHEPGYSAGLKTGTVLPSLKERMFTGAPGLRQRSRSPVRTQDYKRGHSRRSPSRDRSRSDRERTERRPEPARRPGDRSLSDRGHGLKRARASTPDRSREDSEDYRPNFQKRRSQIGAGRDKPPPFGTRMQGTIPAVRQEIISKATTMITPACGLPIKPLGDFNEGPIQQFGANQPYGNGPRDFRNQPRPPFAMQSRFGKRKELTEEETLKKIQNNKRTNEDHSKNYQNQNADKSLNYKGPAPTKPLNYGQTAKDSQNKNEPRKFGFHLSEKHRDTIYLRNAAEIVYVIVGTRPIKKTFIKSHYKPFIVGLKKLVESRLRDLSNNEPPGTELLGNYREAFPESTDDATMRTVVSQLKNVSFPVPPIGKKFLTESPWTVSRPLTSAYVSHKPAPLKLAASASTSTVPKLVPGTGTPPYDDIIVRTAAIQTASKIAFRLTQPSAAGKKNLNNREIKLKDILRDLIIDEFERYPLEEISGSGSTFVLQKRFYENNDSLKIRRLMDLAVQKYNTVNEVPYDGVLSYPGKNAGKKFLTESPWTVSRPLKSADISHKPAPLKLAASASTSTVPKLVPGTGTPPYDDIIVRTAAVQTASKITFRLTKPSAADDDELNERHPAMMKITNNNILVKSVRQSATYYIALNLLSPGAKSKNEVKAMELALLPLLQKEVEEELKKILPATFLDTPDDQVTFKLYHSKVGTERNRRLVDAAIKKFDSMQPYYNRYSGVFTMPRRITVLRTPASCRAKLVDTERLRAPDYHEAAFVMELWPDLCKDHVAKPKAKVRLTEAQKKMRVDIWKDYASVMIESEMSKLIREQYKKHCLKLGLNEMQQQVKKQISKRIEALKPAQAVDNMSIKSIVSLYRVSHPASGDGALLKTVVDKMLSEHSVNGMLRVGAPSERVQLYKWVASAAEAVVGEVTGADGGTLAQKELRKAVRERFHKIISNKESSIKGVEELIKLYRKDFPCGNDEAFVKTVAEEIEKKGQRAADQKIADDQSEEATSQQSKGTSDQQASTSKRIRYASRQLLVTEIMYGTSCSRPRRPSQRHSALQSAVSAEVRRRLDEITAGEHAAIGSKEELVREYRRRHAATGDGELLAELRRAVDADAAVRQPPGGKDATKTKRVPVAIVDLTCDDDISNDVVSNNLAGVGTGKIVMPYAAGIDAADDGSAAIDSPEINNDVPEDFVDPGKIVVSDAAGIDAADDGSAAIDSPEINDDVPEDFVDPGKIVVSDAAGIDAADDGSAAFDSPEVNNDDLEDFVDPEKIVMSDAAGIDAADDGSAAIDSPEINDDDLEDFVDPGEIGYWSDAASTDAEDYESAAIDSPEINDDDLEDFVDPGEMVMPDATGIDAEDDGSAAIDSPEINDDDLEDFVDPGEMVMPDATGIDAENDRSAAKDSPEINDDVPEDFVDPGEMVTPDATGIDAEDDGSAAIDSPEINDDDLEDFVDPDDIVMSDAASIDTDDDESAAIDSIEIDDYDLEDY